MNRTAKEVKDILYKATHCDSVVELERIPNEIWAKYGFHNKVNLHEIEKPSHKKIKSENNKKEIPKLILSKKGNIFKSKLVYLKKGNSQNKLKRTSLSSEKNNGQLKITPNEIKVNKTEISSENIENNVITNKLWNYKIRVTNVDTINYNYDLVRMDLLFFDGFMKYKTFQIAKKPVFNLHLEINKCIIYHFEEIHRKYMNESVQHSIIIMNNILFVNLFTSLHCISKINSVLETKNQNEMRKRVLNLSILNANYVNMTDNLLRKIFIEIISLFKDSDYEHGLLLLLINISNGLKVYGNNLFENSNVILQKFQQIFWENKEKENVEKFNHNKIICILKSDIFCTYYKALIKLIGNKSNTYPELIRFGKLFFIPSILKNMQYFHSAYEAIENSAEIDNVENLLNEASNNVRSCSSIENSENSSLNAIKIKKYISFINNSTKKNDSNKTDLPSTSGYNSYINKQIQNKNKTTLLDGCTIKSGDLDPNILDKDFPSTSVAKIFNEKCPGIIINNKLEKSNSIQLQNGPNKNILITETLDSVSSFEESQIYNIIPNENTAPVFHTEAIRRAELNIMSMSFPNTKFTCYSKKQKITENVGQHKTTSTSTKFDYIHKKFNFKYRQVL